MRLLALLAATMMLVGCAAKHPASSNFAHITFPANCGKDGGPPTVDILQNKCTSLNDHQWDCNGHTRVTAYCYQVVK